MLTKYLEKRNYVYIYEQKNNIDKAKYKNMKKIYICVCVLYVR